MNRLAHEWEDRTWIEMEELRLYPPESITKLQGALELIKGECFLGKRVLDAGCGTGWFGSLLQERGATVVGVDSSGTMVAEASRRIAVRNASVCALPFDMELFDSVVCFMVLHILDDPAVAMRELTRVLKPEGTLFLGIVHPLSEVWDLASGLCHCDPAAFERAEERPWVFNLTDGRRLVKRYIHRPWAYWESLATQSYRVGARYEPLFPLAMQEHGRYANREYLFLALDKV